MNPDDIFAQNLGGDPVDLLAPIPDNDTGFFENTRNEIAKEAFKTYRTGVVLGAADSVIRDNIAGTLDQSAAAFKRLDKANADIEDYTPDYNQVSIASETASQLLGVASPLLLGPFAGGAIMAANALTSAATEDVSKHNVPAGKALAHGVVDAAVIAAGVALPGAIGTTLKTRIGSGVALNTGLGVVNRAIDQKILEGNDAAKNYQPFDSRAIVADAGLGVLAGLSTHVEAELRPKVDESITVLADAQHFNKAATPGDPVDGKSFAKGQQALADTIDAISNDKPIVLDSTLQGASFRPNEADMLARGNAILDAHGVSEIRADLPFNHVALDDYARLVENAYGIPQGLIVALKNKGERSNSRQVSPAGAKGVMQFMPENLEKFGVTDPTDPVQAINAAGKYLHETLRQYDGNVDAVIADYNGGPKQAKLVMDGLEPAAKETKAYLKRVKAGMTAADTSLPIADRITRQLVDTGHYTKDDAAVSAVPMLKYIETRANDLGLTPDEFYARYGTDVIGAELDAEGYHQFAGQRAETADLGELQSAITRIGRGDDPEIVRQETGWHQGVDKKWRFEIDDSQATFIGKAALETAAKTDPYGVAEMPLSQVLDHPALFKAYPALKDVTIYFDSDVGATGGGYSGAMYQVEDNTIILGSGLTDAEMHSGLLHEVQHVIQERENFARGGSATKVGKDNYQRLAGEIEARNTQKRANLSAFERKATPPEVTADVPANEAIIVWNGKEMHVNNDANAKLLFQKIKPPKKLYRGVAVGTEGTGVYSLGKGIYSTPSKKFASKFGTVTEISIEEAWPRNPLVLHGSSSALDLFKDWIFQNSTFKNIREFNKHYPDPGQFVREKGYDGVIANDEVVYYGNTTDILAQDAHGSGTTGFFDPQRNIIGLLKSADKSTFLHESAHSFLELDTRFAAMENAPKRIKDDFNRTLKWLGVADMEQWQRMSVDEKRPYHEKFARGFEQYLREGKAPTHELRDVFKRFKQWLTNIYQTAEELNVELSPEIRSVFDSMLGKQKPKATDGTIKTPEEHAFEITAAEHPDLMVTLEDGTEMRIADLNDMLNEEIAQAVNDAKAYAAAVTCFLSH